MNTNQPTNQPPNPNPILKRFNRNTPEVSSSDESSDSVLSGSDWRKIKALVDQTTADRTSKEVKKLHRSLHHISTQHELLHHEMNGLKEALSTKKKQQKKSHPLDLQTNQDGYHSRAVFWSPRKFRQARERRVVEEREKDKLQLQKARRLEVKEQARLHKLQVAQEKRVERERQKEVREKEKAEKIAKRAREKAARSPQKVIQTTQKSKRKASQSSNKSNKRQKRVIDGTVMGESLGVASAPPPTTTRYGRNIKFTSRYK